MSHLAKFLEQHPTKPGGRPWRPAELATLEGRAMGRTWKQIAEVTELQESTVISYQKRAWWQSAFAWFVSDLLGQADEEQQRQAREERARWQREDAQLKALGTKLALRTLFEVMQGQRTRCEVTYRELIAAGTPVDVAEQKARYAGRLPTPGDRVLAARTFLDASGYKTANQEIAKLAIDEERKAKEVGGGAESVDVNVTIDGVDVIETHDPLAHLELNNE